jgi:hypothetical protein
MDEGPDCDYYDDLDAARWAGFMDWSVADCLQDAKT